jgi:kanamycin kinase
MKLTLLDSLPFEAEGELGRLVCNARIYDSSSSPEARVYFIDRDGGYFLKKGASGTLLREAEMTKYFHSLGLGAEVLSYESSEYDLLLTRKISGEDCTARKYLDNPKKLCDTMALTLRELHEKDYTGCPITDRTAEYLKVAHANFIAGNFDSSHFPDSFGYRSAEEAMAVLSEGEGALKSDVLIHGDYCMPNIILQDWKISGFVDVACGGIGDRHIDLFWGAWTLLFNLGTDEYKPRFLDAYGRDKVDEHLLRVVAAAEVFG